MEDKEGEEECSQVMEMGDGIVNIELNWTERKDGEFWRGCIYLVCVFLFSCTSLPGHRGCAPCHVTSPVSTSTSNCLPITHNGLSHPRLFTPHFVFNP